MAKRTRKTEPKALSPEGAPVIPEAPKPVVTALPQFEDAVTLGELNRMRERNCSFVDFINRNK